ncbi:hypothetical protein EPN18_08360 [bacterium]|nr:MAG: hypothetical protein EPN18_08360 [bacterium]
MKILVIGTPKRDFHIGFDTFVLGLSKTGMEFDHYPDIVKQSYGQTGTYQMKFEGRGISYPAYQEVVRNLKRKKYGLIITTVARVDYGGGKHGVLSTVSRSLKYSLQSNKHKMGGTLVLDWIKQGLKLPPFAVLDDLDEPFIHPVDYGLLLHSAMYFKRELPFNRFMAFRLFKFHLTNEELMTLALKLRPVWTGYDPDSISVCTPMDGLTPYHERDIDITFLGSTYASYQRRLLLPLLDKLAEKYKVVSPKNGRLTKAEFYSTLKRSKICVSPEGRGWDAPKHYELPLFGGLLFLNRPTIEIKAGFKDAENCVFVDNLFRDFDSLSRHYLSNIARSAVIAQKGHELAKNELDCGSLARYVVNSLKEVV